MRPAPFSFVARAVLEPPVFDDTARPPVIVRLVGGGGSFTNDPYGTFAPRWNENPGKDNHGGLSLRRAKSPRAAANGRSRSIHARFHGFVGAAREPPVFLTTRPDPPVIVRLVGAGGAFPNDPYGIFARRRDGNMREGQPRGIVPAEGPNRRGRRHRRPANGALRSDGA